MKRNGIFLCAFALCVCIGSTPSHAEVINRIVATVDGAPITLHEMQGYQSEAGAGASPLAPDGLTG